MKYTQKSFNSPASSEAYRDNFDRIFRQKKAESEFPDVPEGLIERIAELHAAGDKAWAADRKSSSSAYHDEAFELGEPYGLNPLPCAECDCYMAARDLAEHSRGAHAK